MKRLALAALATAFSLTAGAAFAADIYVPPKGAAPLPPPPAVYSWSGLYLGIQGGWDSNNVSTPPYSATASGGLVGLYGGYNFALAPSIILGIDTSINYDWANAHSTTPTTFDAGPDWKGFIRGRLGFAMDKLLLYGTAGGAWMHYVASGSGTEAEATPWGWTVGGGVEMAFSPNLTGRLDYAYQNYGTFTINGNGAFDGTSVSATAHTVTAGVAFKY